MEKKSWLVFLLLVTGCTLQAPIGQVGSAFQDSVDVKQGWNFIGLHQSGSLDTSEIEVALFSYESGSWRKKSDLSVIGGKGYWIDAAQDGKIVIKDAKEVKTMQLEKGFNAIGIPSLTQLNTNQLLLDGQPVDSVYTWDGKNAQAPLQPSVGYVLLLSKAGILEVKSTQPVREKITEEKLENSRKNVLASLEKQKVDFLVMVLPDGNVEVDLKEIPEAQIKEKAAKVAAAVAVTHTFAEKIIVTFTDKDDNQLQAYEIQTNKVLRTMVESSSLTAAVVATLTGKATQDSLSQKLQQQLIIYKPEPEEPTIVKGEGDDPFYYEEVTGCYYSSDENAAYKDAKKNLTENVFVNEDNEKLAKQLEGKLSELTGGAVVTGYEALDVEKYATQYTTCMRTKGRALFC